MILTQHITDLLQILLIAVVVYTLFRLVRGTRTASILIGFTSFIFTLWAVTVLFNLDVIAYALRALSVYFGLAVIVVFHPEIRKILARLGTMSFGGIWRGQTESPVDILTDAALDLSRKKTGALIAVERQEALTHYAETGVALDSLLSTELIVSIFTPPLPLHDGGLIVRGSRILAARCMFPLTNRAVEGHHSPETHTGMRHRAAIGLSEDTDALVIVVSEETGGISVAHDGDIRRNIAPHNLQRYLKAVFIPKDKLGDTFPLVFGSHGTGRFSRMVLNLFRSRN